jgi:hypothetical protein
MLYTRRSFPQKGWTTDLYQAEKTFLPLNPHAAKIYGFGLIVFNLPDSSNAYFHLLSGLNLSTPQRPILNFTPGGKL